MSEPVSSWRVLYAELRRRRVFRVATVYGVVGFGLLQVVDLVVPALLLPEWVYRVVAFLLLIGLPIAVLLAWAFETSPDGGVQRTRPATAAEIEAATSGSAATRWLIPLLALAGVTIFAVGTWWAVSREDTDAVADVGLAYEAADVRTLAILPFQNVSGTEENGALARGIQQGLLDGFGRIGALRVTSLMSVREYEDSPKSLREIGSELGVRYLVEGSVQKAGDRMQVSAALVDAETDERVWSERYDRVVREETLFDVQADVATSVVRALTVRLTPEERELLEASAGSTDLAARGWMQRGLEAAYRGGFDGIEEAQEAIERAVAIDPGYVGAWTELVRVAGRRYFATGVEADRARSALDRVETLAPESHFAALGRGYYAYYVETDFPRARDEFERALEAVPSDAEAWMALGLIQRRLGEWRSSTLAFRRAVRLDPRNGLRVQLLYENLTNLGVFAEADALIEHALAVDSESPHARAWKVWNVFEARGIEAARRLAAEFGLTGAHPSEMQVLVGMEMTAREYPRALVVLSAWDAVPDPVIQAARLGIKAFILWQMDDPAVTSVSDSALAALGAEDSEIRRQLPAILYVQTLAAAGRREAALRALRSIEADAREMGDHIVDVNNALQIVGLYGQLGERDDGLALLEEIIESPSDDLSAFVLEQSPAYDPFRSDPRFAALVERRQRFEEENAAWAAQHRPWVP